MMLAQGLFEAHLKVSDLARAMKFYREVVGRELTGLQGEAIRSA